jgi:prepilin-type N-terminal cleavage/methylation domain-containing protein
MGYGRSPRWRISRAPERGDTLLELMIAIAILSVGVLGIYSTLSSSIIASDAVKGRADASQLVTQVGDVIQRAEWECVDPPGDMFSKALGNLKPTLSWTIEVMNVSHWAASRSFEAGCPAPDADPVFRTLKLTVLVKAPGVRGQQSVEITKRP